MALAYEYATTRSKNMLQSNLGVKHPPKKRFVKTQSQDMRYLNNDNYGGEKHVLANLTYSTDHDHFLVRFRAPEVSAIKRARNSIWVVDNHTSL